MSVGKDYQQSLIPFSCFESFRPTYGTPKALERAGLSMSDIDVFEFHEAFAVSYDETKQICVSYLERWLNVCIDLTVRISHGLCLSSCPPGSDNGESEGYGLGLVRPDIHGQENKGKYSCESELNFELV